MVIEQVWIDHCNICSMDTDYIDSYPDVSPTCTYMGGCGELFDRPYRENELDFVDGWAYMKGTAPTESNS